MEFYMQKLLIKPEDHADVPASPWFQLSLLLAAVPFRHSTLSDAAAASLLFSAVLFSAVLFSAVLFSAVLISTVLLSFVSVSTTASESSITATSADEIGRVA